MHEDATWEFQRASLVLRTSATSALTAKMRVCWWRQLVSEIEIQPVIWVQPVNWGHPELNFQLCSGSTWETQGVTSTFNASYKFV